MGRMEQSHELKITMAVAAGLAALGSLIGGGITAGLMTWVSTLLDLDNPASAAKDFQGLLGTVGVAGVIIGISGGCWLALRTKRHPKAIPIAVAAPLLTGLLLLLLVAVGPDQPNFPTLLVLFALGGGLAALALGKSR